MQTVKKLKRNKEFMFYKLQKAKKQGFIIILQTLKKGLYFCTMENAGKKG